jgi:hypothetical protein
LCFSCACGRCVPFRLHSFRSASYLDRTNTSFHLHYKHTPQHRTASVVSFLFHSASSINSVSHYPSPFQRISNGFFLLPASSLPQNNLNSPPPISGCGFVNISLLILHVLAAGCFHSLLTIRGRQFVPHRHPPSLQSLHSITPASAPHCISVSQPRPTVCLSPMHFS